MTVGRAASLLSVLLVASACGPEDEATPGDAIGDVGARGDASPSGSSDAVAAGPAGPIADAFAAAPNAKVDLIEFGDYQCPFCQKAEATVAALTEAYGDALRVTFLNQPMPFHGAARAAAIAAEAARKQGKLAPFRAKLFANQQALTAPDLERYAADVELDLARFRADVADPATAGMVELHAAIAGAVGATGTPSFFIDGKLVRGAQPIEKLREVIDAEIAEADKAGKKGDAWLRERLEAQNAALFGYLFGGGAPPKPLRSPPPVDRTVYKVEVDPTVDPWKGEATAPITMVVFGDFQCPFCKKLEPTLGEVMAKYPGKVRLVWKNNPLPFHGRAVPAAHAALCAHEQGKFWELHDQLFANQQALAAPDLEGYAGAVGLDLARFKDCMTKAPDAFRERLARDVEQAGKVTARGTPNVFINGRKVTGARPLTELAAIVDAELERADALAKTGVAPADLYAALIKDGKIFEPLEAGVSELSADPATGPVDGRPDAKIRVTAFVDFQCPFSARLAQPLRDLKKKYGDDLALSVKMFPLAFHQHAMAAAIGAECALAQGRFWPFYDALFAAQKDLSADKVTEVAGAVGLDAAAFDACVAANTHKARIDADLAEGRAAGVRGTPTVFINGRKFNAPAGYTVDSLSSVIDRAILGR